MIPSLTPTQAAWLSAQAALPSAHADTAPRVLSPEDAANINAQRGILLRRGGMTVLLGQDLQGHWIFGGRPNAPLSPWWRTRHFPVVPAALWPSTDHALLLGGTGDFPAHQRLAAEALAQALSHVPAPPWPMLVAIGAPGALLLAGVPVADATGFFLCLPPVNSPLPPLLAVLPESEGIP